jgi:SLOG family YspA-like protein
MHILVTGSRNWTDRTVIRRAISDAINQWLAKGGSGYVTVVHGGAHGADTIADEFARELRCAVEVHYAQWERYGKAAGHKRNAEMVKAGADICLAFPLGDSPGTRGCMQLAEKAGIPVVVHEGAPAVTS